MNTGFQSSSGTFIRKAINKCDISETFVKVLFLCSFVFLSIRHTCAYIYICPDASVVLPSGTRQLQANPSVAGPRLSSV